MRDALKLFEKLEIKYVPCSEIRRGVPMLTCSAKFVSNLIEKHGLPHVTVTLRAIVEREGNAAELISDVIGAVSDVILSHPRWPKLGLQFIEAFDRISLSEVRKTAKAANVQPLRVGVATLIAIELSKILGPSRPAKPPAKSKAEIMQGKLALGSALLKLKAEEKPARFAALVFERLKLNSQATIVYRAMTAAKLYADRPEITGLISWEGLAALAAPATPPAVRRKLEAAILTGQRVRLSHVRRARLAHAQRQPDQPATRMAA